MSEIIQIQWTTGNIEEARKVCRELVEQHLVACAQIIPWIESHYLWDGKLQNEQESKVLLKTSKEKYEQVREIIQRETTYEVPEITWVRIEGGNVEYLRWIEESLTV